MDQQELINAILGNQVAGIGPVHKHIETHLSHLFLTADRAYKLKRAIKLPFVDYSTVETRRLGCMAETDINTKLGSPLYYGAIPVCRSREGRFWIGLEAEVIDYLVVMHRFPDGQQCDELAQAGALTLKHVERIANRIAGMHLEAPSSMHFGRIADYRSVLSGLEATEADGAARSGLEPGDRQIYDSIDRALSRAAPLIERRRRGGKVKRTHGDLHLGNLCVFQGEPIAFDALEFNEALATSDVLFDLAFLLMDLKTRMLDQHANAVMNCYWDAAQEEEIALAMLPVFMTIRAMTRMAVSLEQEKLEAADRYRQLAHRLLQRSHSHQIAIGGLSGSGKSTVARLLAPCLPGAVGARILRTDNLRLQSGPAPRYSEADRLVVYDRLGKVFREAAGAGVSVIADATFEMEGLDKSMWFEPGGHIRRFWIRTPKTVRLSRVAARVGDVSEIAPDVAARQREPAHVDARWTVLDGMAPPEAIVQAVLKELRHEVHAA